MASALAAYRRRPPSPASGRASCEPEAIEIGNYTIAVLIGWAIAAWALRSELFSDSDKSSNLGRPKWRWFFVELTAFMRRSEPPEQGVPGCSGGLNGCRGRRRAGMRIPAGWPQRGSHAAVRPAGVVHLCLAIPALTAGNPYGVRISGQVLTVSFLVSYMFVHRRPWASTRRR
jgi:hypothetical protein